MSDKNKLILKGILVFSIASLSIAYFIQYILGHKPCNLCLVERIPYFASVVLITLMLLIDRFQKIIIIFILLFLIFGSVVSFYHVGIEQGFFNESFVCNLENSGSNISKDQLLQQLENAPISCKDVTFKFIGLSLATINTVISLILSVIIINILRNYEQNK